MRWLGKSLSGRIALLVLGLLLVVGGGLSWMSHRAVRRQISTAFHDRLTSLASQFAESGARGPREALARLTRLAADPSLADALAPGATAAQRSRALSLMVAGLPPDRRTVLVLMDTTGGGRIAASHHDSLQWFGPEPDPRPAVRHVGPVGRLNDSVAYSDTRVPVLRGDRPVGLLIQRTRSTLSPASADAVARLLGASIRYVSGDPSSGIWNDLARFIPAPPAAALAADSVSRFLWDGTAYLGITSRVAGTPYLFLLLAPERAVMAPANALLRNAVLFGIAALLLGGAGAFLLGRWIGRPIEAMARGADRLAGGDTWTKADELAPGEVGQLARAFNHMVRQVHSTTRHLSESEERFRLLAENGRDIVSLRDSEGRAVYLSPSASALLGHSAELLVSPSVDQLIHPDDVELRSRARTEVVRPDGAGVATATYRIRHADGSWIWMETLYRRMPAAEGAAPGLLSASRDITQRKLLESQVLQSQKLEAIGRLAGGVAHDFNNLLTAIVGGVQAAQECLPADHPCHLYLSEVSFASDRAATLTRQLLTFSRHHVVQPVNLDINLVLVDMDRLLRRVIGEDIELRTSVTDGIPPVRIDPGQMSQVLMNLALNARDAMPNGGRLTIETRPVDLDAAYANEHAGVVPGPYVMLAVTDTGTGIEPDVAEHLFEPFFTTKAVGKGTGLGLATSFGIVTEAGGHIWFYTELGQGTTFKVYFPQAKDAAPQLNRAKPVSEPRGTELLLVVEDDESVRIPTTRMLRSMGYTVLEATNGGVAIAMLADTSAPIDLVVTDMIMPQMGGVEMMKHFHGLHPQLRVLFLSGYTQDALMANGSIISDVHFLQKPFTRGELSRAVRRALDVPTVQNGRHAM